MVLTVYTEILQMFVQLGMGVLKITKIFREPCGKELYVMKIESHITLWI
jgi:hypothetical protein